MLKNRETAIVPRRQVVEVKRTERFRDRAVDAVVVGLGYVAGYARVMLLTLAVIGTAYMAVDGPGSSSARQVVANVVDAIGGGEMVLAQTELTVPAEFNAYAIGNSVLSSLAPGVTVVTAVLGILAICGILWSFLRRPSKRVTNPS